MKHALWAVLLAAYGTAWCAAAPAYPEISVKVTPIKVKKKSLAGGR